ncbi:MAG: NAD(P)/FAD-dependent oxidoreductase [Candidatus Thermoplasmatota archaeon]
MNYDIIVVGAGPVGCYTAKLIAEKGFSVALIEEHPEIGYPVHCTGLVSSRVVELTNSKKAVIKEFRSAKIHSATKELFIEAPKSRAFVLDRARFDKLLAKGALDKGVDLLLHTKVINAERMHDGTASVKILKDGKKEDLKCNILIGADGANSTVAKAFLLSRAKELLCGINAEIAFDKEQDYIDIFVTKNLAPNFFAWLIPLNSFAKIGLCTRTNTYLCFKKFLKLLNSEKLISFNAGIIPFGLAKKTYTDNVMLVGNAACHVKPLSGGGIYTGLVSAQHCAKVAISALEKGDYSAKVLKEYQKLWHSELGRELKLGLLARNVFKRLADKDFDSILANLNNSKTLALILEYGDLDYHSKIMKALLQAPQVTMLRYLLKGFFR